ncbi:MAG: uroporphyrinogen decarboxylase [Eubacteriales bacterium]|nr:uroporphyrinogen decarboxylase [Eubacteriales bacterium]
MTRREAVIRALRHEETEILPYHLELTAQENDRVAAATGEKDFAAHTGGFLHYMQYWGYPTERSDRPLYFTDDFGVTWNRSGVDRDIGVIDSPVIREPDLSLYPAPYLNEKRIREECERLLATADDRFCFAGIGFSMFERLWSYTGMEDALYYMAAEPAFVHGMLDRILAFNLSVIDIFNEYPFDAVYFGDDWGQQHGMIMEPRLWRKFLKPRMAEMYARAKKNGKFIIQHSCGDVEDVFPDLIEIGLDCYQTVQPEIYGLARIKEKYGDKLAFWGGISTQRDLPVRTPEEVRALVRETADVMRPGGGYILAPTHAVPQDVPPANILAMLDECRRESVRLVR